jgi:dTMP kinase
VTTTREPGGTALGRELRAAFLETSETVAPMAELLAFAADRAQHVETLIKPALSQGKIVISDRYADATAAYQGAGRELSRANVAEVIRLATNGLKPDLTIFFDISVQCAIERTGSRSDGHAPKNRMDEETAEFYGRVRDEYLAISHREPERFKVISGERPIDIIQENVTALVSSAIQST